MNKFFLAALCALGLGKLASINQNWIHTKMGYYTSDKEIYELLQTVDLIYQKLGLYELKAYSFIPLMKGMEDSVLILNFLLTYTPILFISFFIISLPFKKFRKQKNPGNDIPEKIRLYLDYKLEIEFKKRIQKEVQIELLKHKRKGNF